MTTTVIDTPAGIANWYYLSAVSQLTLELRTGRNYYGRTSVLTALVNRGWFEPQRATKRNKLIALATLIDNAGDEATGPVFDRAIETVANVSKEMGVILVPAE